MTNALDGLRIGLLTASASRLGGGVFEAVVQQAEMISSLGGIPVTIALEDAHSQEDRHRFGAHEVFHAPVRGPRQVGYAPSLVSTLLAADLDLLHLHGIWMYPSHAGAAWARRTGRPYLISPHGMLDPWITARGRAKKAIARLGYERASWSAARRIHALTRRETQDIRRETGRDDSIVIPNAGPNADPAATQEPCAPRAPEFLYLGRIHPKKNIGALIDAWRTRADKLAAIGARLTIAGWGEDAHVAELRAALEDAPPSVAFVGPLFGADKAAAYANARFFVLPSHSEGLPMVVLEAWSVGTPVLMTSECNLPEGYEAGAALDCGFDAPAITASLDRALAMNEDEWLAMSSAARKLAAERFSPAGVAGLWAEAYGELVCARSDQNAA